MQSPTKGREPWAHMKPYSPQWKAARQMHRLSQYSYGAMDVPAAAERFLIGEGTIYGAIQRGVIDYENDTLNVDDGFKTWLKNGRFDKKPKGFEEKPETIQDGLGGTIDVVSLGNALAVGEVVHVPDLPVERDPRDPLDHSVAAQLRRLADEILSLANVLDSQNEAFSKAEHAMKLFKEAMDERGEL